MELLRATITKPISQPVPALTAMASTGKWLLIAGGTGTTLVLLVLSAVT